MIVRAKIDTQVDWLFSEELPDSYSPGGRLVEKRGEIHNDEVDMNNYQVSTHGLFILHSEMKFELPVNILTEVTGDAVACQFVFSNPEGAKNMTGGAAKPGRGRHNIRFIPSRVETHEVKPGMSYVYFLVVLSKAYYLQLVDLNLPINERFIKEMEKGNYMSFAEGDQFVTPEMRQSIEEIRACKREGELKRLYTDARVLELIMFQMEQLSHQNDEERPDFKEDDMLKLENAREILKEQFINPPTHRQLSKMVFLNEFKLRSGFKRYYGATIYDFITGLRMSEARRLIVEKQMNMSEVGSLVGFKHQASFTHAFKKYYGVLPSEVKIQSALR